MGQMQGNSITYRIAVGAQQQGKGIYFTNPAIK